MKGLIHICLESEAQGLGMILKVCYVGSKMSIFCIFLDPLMLNKKKFKQKVQQYLLLRFKSLLSFVNHYFNVYLEKKRNICIYICKNISEYDNKHLVEKKHMHEAQIKSLKDETRKLNEECERLRSETEQLRFDKENLSKGKFDLERNVNALKVRNNSIYTVNPRL